MKPFGYLVVAVVFVNLTFIFPTIGFLFMTIWIVLFPCFFGRSLSYRWFYSMVFGVFFYLSFYETIVLMQGQKWVNDIHIFEQKQHRIPKSLNEIDPFSIVQFSPSFDRFEYQVESKYGQIHWQLKLKNRCGMSYFYDHKSGDFEREKIKAK